MGNGDIVDDERVVYIHNVVGAHTANPMSGEFSVELSNAFWMEGGEFVMHSSRKRNAIRECV